MGGIQPMMKKIGAISKTDIAPLHVLDYIAFRSKCQYLNAIKYIENGFRSLCTLTNFRNPILIIIY